MKTSQELLQLTFRLLSAGQLKEAQRACRKAIEARPDLPDAHLLLSEIHRQGGDAARARESASRALRLRPGWSEGYVALGNAEALAGNLEAAEGQFRSAIAAGTPSPGIHASLGHVLMRQRRLPEARTAYETALSRAPQAPELHFALADVLAELGRNDEAALAYRRAFELDPSFHAARFNHAGALFAAGRNAEAVTTLRELLQLDARAGDARELLLRVLHQSRQFKEMEAVAREGVVLDPTAVVYRHQLAVALWWQERREEAMAAFDALERATQERTSAAYHEAKLDQAITLLVLGRWREGWDAYQWRPTRFPQVSNNPRAVAALDRPARILIVGEQGLGDDLFFLRFAPRLRERGHHLLGALDPRVAQVLPRLFDEMSPSYSAAPQAEFTILSGDLPLATGQEVAPPLTLPIDSQRRAHFETQLRNFGPPPYIGVTWRAGPVPDEVKQQAVFFLAKEVPPEALGAALRPVRATVCILQRRPAADDVQRFLRALGRPALDLSAVNDDLRDALAVLSVLDDYVGVSNTNTHLRAGCPGRTARVLVPANPEWRWGLGERSAWFPEFPLYRQSAREGWTSALEKLTTDLLRLIAA